MSFFSDLDRMWGKEGNPPPRSAKTRAASNPARKWVIILGGLVLLFILASIGKGIYTDWLWFGSLGFSTFSSTLLTTL